MIKFVVILKFELFGVSLLTNAAIVDVVVVDGVTFVIYIDRLYFKVLREFNI